jgi:FKBP12-rapamycin complex-associated protein
MFDVTNTAHQFMTDMYRDVCEIALRLKDSRDHLIRKTVVSILPTLARYDPSAFMDEYLNRCMNHLLSLLKKEKDRKDGMCNDVGYMSHFSIFAILAY